MIKKQITRLAEGIYRWLLHRGLIHTDTTRKLITGLYGGTMQQTEQSVEAYYVQMISRILLIVIVTILFCVCSVVIDGCQQEETVHVVRQGYGEAGDVLTVVYEDDAKDMQEINLEIDAVAYRPEELDEKFAQGFQYLEGVMLGENEDEKNIVCNLNLETAIPDSGLSVTWYSDNYERIADTGKIDNLDMNEPETVWLTLELAYGERTERRDYAVQLQPSNSGTEMWEQVKAELEETIQENIYEQEFDLPSKVQGMNIQTAVSEVHTWLVFLLLGVGGAALLAVRQRSRLQEQMKQRKQLLLQEYPYFMNQILLYTSAGTTVLGAIERMLHQYENVRKTEQPLYQELLRLKNEIHTGVFQEQAYFNFGRRIGLLPYIKASSLFAQQIRKGGGGIEEQLEFEEHDAFEKRKELARKAGEEAGTKLLFPMILLMILSMVLVMYPALMSFTTGGF